MKLFCRHNLVHVVRWHRDLLTKDMASKVLYYDEFDVANLVRCKKCNAFLKTDQKEQLRNPKT